MIPPFETTFAVPLSCEDCIKDLSTSLYKIDGIHNVSADLPSQLISITGTAAPSAIVDAIQSTGRDAILRGSGKAEAAAVCILETHASSVKDNVRGLIRMVQVSPTITILDMTLRGVSPGTYNVTVRETGDISQGAVSTGGIWDAITAKQEKRSVKGVFGTIEVGKSGLGTVFIDKPIQIWEMIGRSIVVGRMQEGFDKEDPDTLVGVIARSAGVWDNDKTVCSCSGKTVWEERKEATAKGRLKSPRNAASSFAASLSSRANHTEGNTVYSATIAYHFFTAERGALHGPRLKFSEFDGRSIPRYVIASHRWARGAREEDREATYLDVREGQNIHTTGFRKVQDFAKYVETHMFGVEWLWVDTCCINKQDAQEVTESINSMFRWYRDSAVCIAWMADVNAADDHEGFESSEWFKRGWTLQELLAPRAMIFLSRDWRLLGHKSSDISRNTGLPLKLGKSLNANITKITGIPETVLRNFQNAKSLSVDERLAWTKNRKTTKEEDMWYCLIGILNAPISANYGEGEDNAKRRLLTEVWRDNSYLEKLPIAQGAAFDDRENELVSECLPDTRVKLLEDIYTWANSKDGQCIFWLVGMAGTGKSTIFKTVAQRFTDRCHLAASFCFKKGEADRGHASQLIPTIAAQLARQLPEVRQSLISILKEEPDVVRKSLREQFDSLILQPLERCNPPPAGRSPWVIGIDALDECDDETDIGTVIGLFAKLEKLRAANIRLFVTSRPELPVRLGFRHISDDTHLDVRLEDVTKDHIAQDIDTFLRHRLADIRSTYAMMYGTNAIGHDWPDDDAVEALVEMVQPLFIFAATACRLLEGLGEHPNETLQMILNYRLEASQLDRTYGPVLEKLLLGKTRTQREQFVHDFQILVGAIVLLQDPLPVPALERLLDMSQTKVHTRLSQLHSVLHVPAIGDQSGQVRPLHLSFRDYLTDPGTREKTRFWIDEAHTHRSLAKKCLRLLVEVWSLEQDLCDVKQPGTRRSKVSREHVAEYIPGDVAYACSYWVWHVVKGGEQICDNGQAHRFLLTHFLHWLEALSWLGKLSEAISFLNDLPQLVKAEQGDQLLAFLADARRFLLRNRYVIDLAPLQIYSSSLVFAPTQSIVRRQFEGSIPPWVPLRPNVHPNWNARIQTLEGHNGTVQALAFSLDGKTIASGSDDGTARLWNAWTGEEICELDGHDYDCVLAVAFSPDGQTLATASETSIRRWDTRTGEIMYEVETYLPAHDQEDDEFVSNIVFSPDMHKIAMGWYRGTLRLWDISTSDEMYSFEGHPESFQALAFSPNGQTVAIGSKDLKVRLHELSTGEKAFELAEHTTSVSALAFSPEGSFLASGYSDGSLWLSKASTPERLYELEGHQKPVTVIAFSSDGHILASGSGDKCIVWDAYTGEERNKFDGHDKAITALAFSPDGQILATGSEDTIIKLWDIRASQESQETQTFDGHENEVPSISFSPDGQKVVTAGLDYTVRLWDAQTGRAMQKLEGHSGPVETATFSPDGRTVASGSTDNTIRIWDGYTGKEIHQVPIKADMPWPIIALSSNGHVILASSYSRKPMRILDTRIGKKIRSSEGHDADIYAVAISRDAKLVASAHYGGTVQLWDAWTMAKIYRFSEVSITSRSKLVFGEDETCLMADDQKLDITPYVSLRDGQCSSWRVTRVSLHEHWLRCLGRDFMWLPREYRGDAWNRGTSWDAGGDTYVKVQASGAVVFIVLKPDLCEQARQQMITTADQPD